MSARSFCKRHQVYDECHESQDGVTDDKASPIPLPAITIDGVDWTPRLYRSGGYYLDATTEHLAAVLAALTDEQRYELYEPFDDRRRDALAQMMTDLDFAKLDIANASDRAEQAESRAAKLESELSAEREGRRVERDSHIRTLYALEKAIDDSERAERKASPPSPPPTEVCYECSGPLPNAVERYALAHPAFHGLWFCRKACSRAAWFSRCRCVGIEPDNRPSENPDCPIHGTGRPPPEETAGKECRGCRLRQRTVDNSGFCIVCRLIREAGGIVPCRGCGERLVKENECIADGCPCNSPRGVNHGLVPENVCTCDVCDPKQTGSVRTQETAGKDGR